jgi:tRNA(His) guanylyltransferase
MFCRDVLGAGYVVVSKDHFPNARNRQRRQLQLTAAALAAGRDVVVDNTNPSPVEWEPLIAAARSAGAQAVAYWFPPDLPASLQRNALRTGRSQVPAVGVRATMALLRRPAPGKGSTKWRPFGGTARAASTLPRWTWRTRVDANEFAASQRDREWFHALTVPPGMWTVIRVDGRGFSRLTEEHFTKPFDERMRQHMLAAATALMTEFGAVFGATHSDEISIALPPGSGLFGRVQEKLVSVSAGVCSAAFTSAAGLPGHFDARIWIGASAEDVTDYFSWRQADAARSALNMWCYWTLRHAGETARQVTASLSGAGTSQQNELLFQHGINFHEIPAWQRRGTGLYWQSSEKPGLDPRTGQATTAIRRSLHIEDQLPVKDDYRALIAAAIIGAGQL